MKLKDLAKAELAAAIASEKASQIEKMEEANLNVWSHQLNSFLIIIKTYNAVIRKMKIQYTIIITKILKRY